MIRVISKKIKKLDYYIIIDIQNMFSKMKRQYLILIGT